MVEPARQHAATTSQRLLTPSAGLSLLWGLNATLFVGSLAWIACDPAVARYIAFEGRHFADISPPSSSTVDPVMVESGYASALLAIAYCAVGSMATVGLALIYGPPRHRQLRSWLAYTALAAAWLGLAVSWRDLAWAGQRWRLGRQVAAIEPIAAALREHWPNDDGNDVPGLGPYMAYPPGKPRMLMLLHQARPTGSSHAVSAIERSNAGGLRFELAAGDAGTWLEWHPPGEKPASFRGGLEGDYRLVRSSPLGEGWHLARYGTTAHSPRDHQ